MEKDHAKVVLLGESGTGKTCIMSQYVNGRYEENCPKTNSASFYSKMIEINNKLIINLFFSNMGFSRRSKISYIE